MTNTTNTTTVADNKAQSTQIKGNTMNEFNKAVQEERITKAKANLVRKGKEATEGNGVTLEVVLEAINNLNKNQLKIDVKNLTVYTNLMESKALPLVTDLIQGYLKSLSGKTSALTACSTLATILESTKWANWASKDSNISPVPFKHALQSITMNLFAEISKVYATQGVRTFVLKSENKESSLGTKYTQVTIYTKMLSTEDTAKDYMSGAFLLEDNVGIPVLSKTKVKRGMVPQTISDSAKECIELMQLKSAAIKLAIDKETATFIAVHSGEALSEVSYETLGKYQKLVTDKQEEIALMIQNNYSELAKEHNVQMISDLVGRMYTSHNKLSWANFQAKGKLNYESAIKEIINESGSIRITHLLAFHHSEETKMTAKGYDNYIEENTLKTIIKDLRAFAKPTKVEKDDERLNFVMPTTAELKKIVQESNPEFTTAELKKATQHLSTKYMEEERQHRSSVYTDVASAMSNWSYIQRTVDAYEDFLNEVPSGFIVLKDFAASGLIWWSVLLKLPLLASYANLLATEDKETYRDPYEAIAIDLITKLGGTLTPELARKMRKAIKSTLQAILHGGAFGPAAKDFSKLNLLGREINEEEMKQAFVNLFGSKITLIRELTVFSQTLVTEKRPFNSWLSPDGTRCLNRFAGAKQKIKVWYAADNANGKAYITLKERTAYQIDKVTGQAVSGMVGEVDKYDNEVSHTAKNNGFAANFLHSIDAFVARMIMKTLKGKLYIFVHDNYGTHANDVHLVEKATRNAIDFIGRQNFTQRAVDGMIKEANENFQKEANFEVRKEALDTFKAKCVKEGTKFKVSNLPENSYKDQACKVENAWNLQLGTIFKEIPLSEEFHYLQY